MVKLQVYIDQDCWSCIESHKIVAELADQFPQLNVEMVDMGFQDYPEFVFAVPTYVLNGRIVSLGNPYREDLRRRIQALIHTDVM